MPSADTTDQFHKLVSGSPLRGNQNVAIVSLVSHLNGVTNKKPPSGSEGCYLYTIQFDYMIIPTARLFYALTGKLL